MYIQGSIYIPNNIYVCVLWIMKSFVANERNTYKKYLKKSSNDALNLKT